MGGVDLQVEEDVVDMLTILACWNGSRSRMRDKTLKILTWRPAKLQVERLQLARNRSRAVRAFWQAQLSQRGTDTAEKQEPQTARQWCFLTGSS